MPKPKRIRTPDALLAQGVTHAEYVRSAASPGFAAVEKSGGAFLFEMSEVSMHASSVFLRRAEEAEGRARDAEVQVAMLKSLLVGRSA